MIPCNVPEVGSVVLPGQADHPIAESRTRPASTPPTSGIADAPTRATEDTGQVDVREALYNDGAKGKAGQIQVPLEGITRLAGLVIDLDPDLIHPENGIFPPAQEAVVFFRGISPVLERHPLLRYAEVRASGNGLHLLVLIDPPVELRTNGEQRHWDAIAKMIQRTLPADPRAPGITALTRAVGSLNGKNGRPVVLLKDGRPVDQQEVIRFATQVARSPFRTIAEILLGADRTDCCPLCHQHGLTAYDREGRCYHCGRVGLDRLLSVILVGRDDPAQSGGAGSTREVRKDVGRRQGRVTRSQPVDK